MTTSDREHIRSQLSNELQVDGSNASKLPEFEVKMCEVTVASELPYYEYEEDRNNTYKNFSTPKGLVLIINNKKFNHLEERFGTDEDEKNLKWLFTKFGYEITETKNDRTAEQMMNDAREFANNPEHANADSCIVVVLSHGDYDELLGVDYFPIIEDFEKIVNFEKITDLLIKEEYRKKYENFKKITNPLTVVEYRQKFEKFKNDQNENNYNPLDYGRVDTHDFLRCFNSENAKHLAHKPKLFFFQACRGDEHCRFITIDNISKPSTHDIQAYGPTFGSKKKPIEADFIVCYSTASKHVSYRNSLSGSWFVSTICVVFSQFAPKEDLNSLLTRVNKRIAEIDGSLGIKFDIKQISEFSSRLINKFYFFPGVTSPGYPRPPEEKPTGDRNPLNIPRTTQSIGQPRHNVMNTEPLETHIIKSGDTGQAIFIGIGEKLSTERLLRVTGGSAIIEGGLGFHQLNKEVYVKIVNTMGPGVVVTVDCASGDDRIGQQILNDGEGFAFKFKIHVSGRTLFWCDVKTSDGKSHHWDVFKGHQDSQCWYLRGDGIYSGHDDGSNLVKHHGW